MTTFAERLKNAMEQANMSQSALSEQAGASKAAISQYLSGKNTPGPDRIKALADATGVSFDYLMGYGAAPVAEPPIKKISVKEAARCMGKSDQFVRIGLQRGLLPFGNAVPGTGACWNYYINPTKFRDYVGADQFNSFFGLTAFTLIMVWKTENLEPLAYLIPAIFAELATATGFYYSKAKAENRIKLRKLYGPEIYNDAKEI